MASIENDSDGFVGVVVGVAVGSLSVVVRRAASIRRIFGAGDDDDDAVVDAIDEADDDGDVWHTG